MPLIERTEIPVRFSEVDSMRIVWHGHYLLYFEEGREAFGHKYGISYLDIFANKLMTPLVKISCEYKKPLEYGDIAVVETRFIDSPAAKICFEYSVFKNGSDEVIATGESTQVFLDMNFNLVLIPPEPFVKWKEQWKKFLD